MSSAKNRAERLQDYLDDRMSPAERAAFLRELERDAGLRSELATDEAVRAALRDTSDVELPGGLVAGARVRFEAERRGTRRDTPRPVRWLSWEAAGLATAALLAVAVFLPGWLREELPSPPDGTRESLTSPTTERDEHLSRPSKPMEEQQSERQEADTDRPAAGFAPAEDDSSANRRKELEPTRPMQEEPQSPSLTDRAAGGPTDTPPPPPRAAPAPTAPSGQSSGASRISARSEAERAATHPTETTEPDRPTWQEDSDALAPAGRADEGAAEKKGFAKLQARSFAVAAVEGPRAIVDGRPLVPGRIEPNRWRIEKTGEPTPGERWLLVGPRDIPFVCTGALLERREAGYHVRLAPPAAGTAAASGGCALALPDDDVPVVAVSVARPDE